MTQPSDGYEYIVDFHTPVDAPPRRVVSLVPSMTESLFDLALGDRLIGVTDYCIHPTEGVQHLPKVGGTKNPDIDKITALAPDLVIMNVEENRREDAEALQTAGIPVWATHPKTVQQALNLLWKIMEIFDEPRMVERVRWIERQVDWTAAAAKAAEPVRVFVPIWYDPWMTFNDDTFSHDILRVCGGMNVFAERQRQFPLEADLDEAEPWPPDDPRLADRDTRYPRLALAEIEAAQPDVILLPSEPFAFGPEHAGILRKLDIPAAKQDRIYPVDGSLLTWHGTRIAYAVSELPGLLAGSEG